LTEVRAGSVERLQLNGTKSVWQMHSKNCNKKNNGHRNRRQGDQSPYQDHHAADEFDNDGRPAQKEGNWKPMACNTPMKSSGPRASLA
jgi:hypothetical protein